VLVDEASESVAALDRFDPRSRRGVGGLEPAAAVRPLVVVVLQVLAQDAVAKPSDLQNAASSQLGWTGA
jgi:hypothetical protein